MTEKNFSDAGAKRGKLLRISDFAAMCDTTKDTLLHYEQKGLLLPRHVSANGYRWYDPGQFLDFVVIDLLKKSGSTLAEIQKVRAGGAGADCLEFMDMHVRLLRKEHVRLGRRLAMLETVLRLAEETLAAAPDTLGFARWQARKVCLYAVDAEKLSASAGTAAEYAACLCESLADCAELPLGTVIDAAHVRARMFRMSWFFCVEELRGQITEIPEGKYAIWFHHGDWKSHEGTFGSMLAELARQGLTPEGDMYVFDLMSYVLLEGGPEYHAKYAVRVAKRRGRVPSPPPSMGKGLPVRGD